ncbi:MAG TPA: nucleotidyltransferase family protein [Methanoregulaceae archaeon]|nr:nucleotidyltransferase family protein [Methanoregulaceae archaeon]HQJ88529.1 nucleotidyltransferase family protein [Methanoregulaceae archaeon]
MKTRDEVIAILADLKAEVAPHFGVRRFGLFGSYARNEQSEDSDLDLLVGFERPVPFSVLYRVEELVRERTGIVVDLTTPDGLHPRIERRVLTEAVNI